MKQRIVLGAMLLAITFLFGCTQIPGQQAQFVCGDGKIVSDRTLCLSNAGEEKTVTKYVCSDGKTTVDSIASCPPKQEETVTLDLETELAVCSGMPETKSGSLEDACIIGIAGKREDSSLCRKVGTNQRTNCYIVVAEILGDSSKCDEAGTSKDQCYEQYSREMNDSTVCEKITNISNKDNCYNSMSSNTADPELCEKIKNINTKDSCYQNIAMRLGDKTYCDKITNANLKQSCIQNMSPQQYVPSK